MSISNETQSQLLPAISKGAGNNIWKKTTKSLFNSKTGIVGLIIVLIMCCMAVFAPVLAPHDPVKTNVKVRLLPPSWMDGGSPEYPLGTDNLGRDMLSRLIYGSQISLLVGVCAVVVAGVIGVVLGLISGYYGGWIDRVIMRTVDAFHGIPHLLFLLVIMMVVGPGVFTIIFVLGVLGWTSYARVVRGEVLSIKEREFVRASRAIGASDSRIIFSHILPNIISSITVISTTGVASAIISESSLSFLGMGVQAPTVTWGTVLSDGRPYIATSWWIATFPGTAITITVLGIIFLGDWLRDILDPRLKSSGSR
ncbi:ABC transporter permease subunit [Paenibacillus sp. LMG 31456]|uniref:ABC transporter permease subunit n=1 Tax=Paenibacillus foliorum TaxID=2654974 RepID=A0A972GU22_9BACL|nr:ABC transporter permease [Paenibacillus foliorum]NOU96185.1 ABC transporter permease subunit [Paenibacillus foliorum]